MRPVPALRNVRSTRRPATKDVTLRDFSGGLRVTDNEISLKPKYSVSLVNLFADDDTSQRLRFGTKEFATVGGSIVNMIYFAGHIIAARTDGTIYKVTGSGTATVIWNSTIASALPGSPSGWSTGLTIIDFAEFRGSLIITNGVDKPLIISSALAVTYLQDIPSGSNVNTPITRYVTTVANYLVMAYTASNKTLIYISSTGTSGTWPGDSAPNDATSFDVGAYTGDSSSEINGMFSFKNFLVVFFANFSVTFSLGTYNDDGDHTPLVVDNYPKTGTINYKMPVAVDNDLLFPTNTAIVSARKNQLVGTLETRSRSDDLGTSYGDAVALVELGNLDSFAIADPLSKTVFFVLHQADSEIKIFAMRHTDNLRKISWTNIEGWNFTCGCVSEKNRVFFGEDDKIYLYGNEAFEDEEFYADYTTDGDDGNDIDFEWELPWIDAGSRVKSKTMRAITFDTSGEAAFSLQCFVNNFYRSRETGLRTPVTEMAFIAGDGGGFGVPGYGSGGFGGGRRANDERFFGFPFKFKITKLRFYGSTKRLLRISTVSMLYDHGNFRP